MIQFTLNEKEERAAIKFIIAFHARQKKTDNPLSTITYLITPTGVGNNITIKSADGEEIDITDYSSW